MNIDISKYLFLDKWEVTEGAIIFARTSELEQKASRIILPISFRQSNIRRSSVGVVIKASGLEMPESDWYLKPKLARMKPGTLIYYDKNVPTSLPIEEEGVSEDVSAQLFFIHVAVGSGQSYHRTHISITAILNCLSTSFMDMGDSNHICDVLYGFSWQCCKGVNRNMA